MLPNVAYQPQRARGAVGCVRLLAEQPIVVRVGTDPEPDEVVRRLDRQGTVAGPDPSRPEAADLLEV
jgi:hypothetical protein